MKRHIDFRDIRNQYGKLNNEFVDFLDDPIAQFELWIKEALEKGIQDANAMSLATYSNHQTSSRIVLLKEIIDDKLIFFTNYMSKKALDIKENPEVAVNFFWRETEKQVRIKGLAKKGNLNLSKEYFKMRNRKSQIVSWASKQSEEMEKGELLERIEVFSQKFEGREVPCPPHWGAYEISPYYIEFWQGGEDRIHTRIVYEKEGNIWTRKRLAP